MTATSLTMNPDLKSERSKTTFNVEEFAKWWHGGEENLISKRLKEKIICDDGLEDEQETPSSYLSHKELYEFTIKKTARLLQKLRNHMPKVELKLGNYTECLESLREEVSLMEGISALCEGYPISVHFSMFLPTILSQGTLEQQAEWVPKAIDLSIIGTYAQTELGHGTFLRGLETIAQFDPRNDQFILNSPKRSSFKWWPGGLGHTANHAIVLAQTYTRGVYRGLYPFIVQLRHLETHEPLPGIVIGEIGPKIGMKAVNNGFLGFKNFRIPRKNMLMKNARVSYGGVFEKSPVSVLTYGTMVFVRVLIVKQVASYLSFATTIATRYSAVRRQSPIDPNKPEPQIMDHMTQRMKIFPNIAKTMMFKIVANTVWKLYNDVMAELGHGQLDRLSELHALTCCLKAVCSADVAAGVEECRYACGGHGYMTSSNFPSLYGFATAACTYEGENTVLLLQTARFLMKSWQTAIDGKPLMPTVNYLAKYVDRKSSHIWDGTTAGLIETLQCVSANKIRQAFESMENRKANGESSEQAANLTGIQLVQAAALHCRTYIAVIGGEHLKSMNGILSPPLFAVLNQIYELFVVTTCLNHLGDLLNFLCLTQEDVNVLQRKLESLLCELRVNAVGIVDGFDIPDGILKSTLGAYDGNVYERLFTEAMKSPLNKAPVNESFELYLKPMLKAKH